MTTALTMTNSETDEVQMPFFGVDKIPFSSNDDVYEDDNKNEALANTGLIGETFNTDVSPEQQKRRSQQQSSCMQQQHETMTQKQQLFLCQKKKERLERDAAWKAVVQKFKDQVLDESYLASPIRSSTIEAASFYIQKSSQALCDQNNSHHLKTLMPGTHKHLGGAFDPVDGCIYGVPANAKSILCLYPVNRKGHKVTLHKNKDKDNINDDDDHSVVEYRVTFIPLPESCHQFQYKWLRGIFAHGYLWAIPAWADTVLCVDVDAFWGRRPQSVPSTATTPITTSTRRAGDTSVSTEFIVHLIPLPEGHIQQTWQWHGAGINHQKTAIYCIPSNAEHVLKVDLLTKTTSFIPIEVSLETMKKYPDFSLSMTNKWYGGIVGEDNCVYGIPYRSCAVLQISCNSDTATLIGPNYGINKYNWHGGIQVLGKIYAHPSHANTVLVIDTTTNGDHYENINTTNPGSDNICTELPITFLQTKDHEGNSGKYKWLGGAVGIDGNIYCPACDTTAVLKIDVKTQQCTTFGYAGNSKNKWQGGLLGRDGCIYCIPASGQHILRIATTPPPPIAPLSSLAASEGNVLFQNENNRVQLIGGDIIPSHKDKWQGGYQGLDGCLYFIPENGYRVMKVTPPYTLQLTAEGTLKDDDCIVEML